MIPRQGIPDGAVGCPLTGTAFPRRGFGLPLGVSPVKVRHWGEQRCRVTSAVSNAAPPIYAATVASLPAGAARRTAAPANYPRSQRNAPRSQRNAPRWQRAVREACEMPREACEVPREASETPREASQMPREASQMPREASQMPREACEVRRADGGIRPKNHGPATGRVVGSWSGRGGGQAPGVGAPPVILRRTAEKEKRSAVADWPLYTLRARLATTWTRV